MARILGKGGTPRQAFDSRYSSARINLLLVILFTVINIALLMAGGNSYFLFSAFIPYLLVSTGMLMCGRFPEEYYTEELSGMEFYPDAVLIVLTVISVMILALYFLSWLLSKNHKVGWLIFALVFFSLDTLAMFSLGGLALESIIDIVFHAWVIFDLSRGVHAHYKWKNTPIEEPSSVFSAEESQNISDGFVADASLVQDSTILRAAAQEVKHRVLLETEIFGHRVCYRRVKKVNELIIDGYVYDELTASIEPPHELSAHVDGHDFAVGYDGMRSYCKADGAVIEQKTRWY